MTGRKMTEELGMRLEEKDLEAWRAQGWVKCGKTGTGFRQGGTVLGKGPVMGEMMQRGTKDVHIRESKRLEEIVPVWCLLLPLRFQMVERNSTDVLKKI